MKYVLDTSVFGWLTTGLIDISDLPAMGVFIVTRDQFDRLQQQSKATRDKFKEVAMTVMPNRKSRLDTAPFDSGDWRPGGFHEELFTLMESNKVRPDNLQNALIAEMSLKGGWTLITADPMLADALAAAGGRSLVLRGPSRST